MVRTSSLNVFTSLPMSRFFCYRISVSNSLFQNFIWRLPEMKLAKIIQMFLMVPCGTSIIMFGLKLVSYVELVPSQTVQIEH